MNHRDQDSLEIWARRTLQQLPDRRAPSTLLPRVLDAVRREMARPWYARPWRTWPRRFQVFSLAAFGGTLATLLWVSQRAFAHASQWTLPGSVRSSGEITISLAETLFRTVTSAAAMVPDGAWIALAVVVVSTWITSLTLGAACWQIIHPRSYSTFRS